MKLRLRSTEAIYHALFLILAVMAAIFYKERLFVDSSYIIFKTINKGWFHIEHGRGVLGITQILPLIGYAFHLPLKLLLILYSVGQVAFFYILFLLMHYQLKRPAAVVGMLAVVLVGQKWLYFVPMVEIVIGGVLSMLVMSLMRSEKWKDDKWLIIILLSYWLILTSHPLNFLVGFVMLSFDILERGWKVKLHYSMIAFFIIALLLEFLGHDAYEGQKIVSIKESGLSQLLDFEYLTSCFLYLISNYWLPIILGIWTSLYFFKKKKYLQSLLWPGSFLLLFIGAVYRWDISQADWYSEIVLQPLVTISALLFCFAILDSLELKSQRKWMNTFGLLFIVFAGAISFQSKHMVDRTTQLERLVTYQQENNQRKALLDLDNVKRPYNNWMWSAPVEALLISAIDGPDATVSLITEVEKNYGYNKDLINDSAIIFRMFEVMSYEDLNSRYFSFEKSPYREMNTIGGGLEMKSAAAKLQIKPIKEDSLIQILHSKLVLVDVTIDNKSDILLHSDLENKLYLAAHWFKADSLVKWDGERTPLEVDLLGRFSQKVYLRAPEQKGIYTVKFDMVKENEFWMDLQESYTVQVY